MSLLHPDRLPADPTNPQIVIRVSITESDIDGLGHLNQSRYHHFLGMARGRLLRLAPVEHDAVHGAFVVAHAELDYLGEVRLADGFVDVRAAIAAVGRKSVRIDNEIIRPDGVVAARGSAVMVAWDRDGRRSRPLSDVERAAYVGDRATREPRPA